MALNDAQLQTLKTDIEADPVLNAIPNTPDGAVEIALAYAVLEADYWVWKTSVTEEFVTLEESHTGSLFDWSAYIGRSSGERGAWDRLFSLNGSVNPSLPHVRSAFADIFSGGQNSDQRAHLLAAARRLANRAEKLFADGSGDGTTANPDTMAIEGLLDYEDVLRARNLP